MAASERRRSTSSPARLTLLLVANGVCLFVLWRMFQPLFAARSAEAGAVPVLAAASGEDADDLAGGSAAAAPRARATLDEPPLALALSSARATRGRDRALEDAIRARIGAAEEKARNATKGKVGPRTVEVAVHVREAGRAGELVSIDAQRAMRPASNLKLVTSAAGLYLLGADWRFRTVFSSSAPIVEGELKGDLAVRAAGDPLYDPEAQGKVERFFAVVAAELKRHGIRSIAGSLLLDEGSFLEPAPGPAWPPSNQHWAEFCALCGGFNANAGCLTARVHPDRELDAAHVAVEPRAHGLDAKINVATLAKGKLDLRVLARGNELSIAGSIPRSVPEYEVRFAAPDPVLLFGRSALAALRAGGIRVEGGLARKRGAAAGRALAEIDTPLLDLLVPINTHSNNVCADQLYLALGDALGGGGTREGGAHATRMALERLGVPTEGFVQVDGSGLSRDDRVSASMITALIDGVLRLDKRTAQAYVDSLAVGGETGTLEKRRVDGRVRAKTGFIAGTSALSGLVETKEGRTLVFSILVDYPKWEGLNTSCWKPMQDEICKLLGGWNGD